MAFLTYYVHVTKYLPGKTHKQNSNQMVLTQILTLKGDTIWHFVAPIQIGLNLIMQLHWTCMSDYVKNETRKTLYLTFFFSLNCIEAKWFCLNIIKKGAKATKKSLPGFIEATDEAAVTDLGFCKQRNLQQSFFQWRFYCSAKETTLQNIPTPVRPRLHLEACSLYFVNTCARRMHEKPVRYENVWK